jgi:hypothetical protein
VTSTLLKRRAVVAAIVAVVAVVILVIAVAAGGSDHSAVSPTSPSSSSSSTLVRGPAGSAPSIAGSIVTIVGRVQRVDPSGDFVINDGHVEYTIAMSTAVKIADLTGAGLSPDVIQANSSIQVTGALTGSTITAQTVVVPTSAATPPTT